MLRLVPDRGAALAGLRRILRPGGVLAFLVWARETKPWAVEAAFDTALTAAFAGADLRSPARTGVPQGWPHVVSRSGARGAWKAVSRTWRCGRRRSTICSGANEAQALFVDYDRAADLEAMPPHMRDAVIDAFEAQLASLPDAAFSWDAPLVAARAVEPPGP